MSKKNRNHRVSPRHADDFAEAERYIEDSFTALWDAIDSGDLLSAETEIAALLAVPLSVDVSPEVGRHYTDALIANVKGSRATPEGLAACYRIMVSVGSPHVKRAAGKALGDLTASGTFPPEWATDVGKPTPGKAWRCYGVFGETDFIIVTFSYGDAEHALLASIRRTLAPVVTRVAVVPDAAAAFRVVRGMDDPLTRLEEITLAEARWRLEAPLSLTADGVPSDLDPDFFRELPLARSRVRRLPADFPGVPGAAFTATDRAAAVSEFLASPQAAEAGDADVARFWAEVLTGCAGYILGAPLWQVGPSKLAATLLVHVPATFTLSPAQRDGLEPAVTAWTRWAARRMNLDEEALTHLLTELPRMISRFDEAYADPHETVMRAYLRDIAVSDAGLDTLDDWASRRAFAVPHPGERDEDLVPVDATDPEGRAILASAEFGSCKTDPVASKEFVAAVTDVVEELWSCSPSSAWDDARKMLDEGQPRHDIFHTLADRR